MKRKRRLAVAAVIVTLLSTGFAGVSWYTLTASPLCRAADTGPAELGLQGRWLLSGGRERCFLLYVPSGHEGGQALPVVVSIHGLADTAQRHARMTGWQAIAEREGFVAVFPEGTGFPLRWHSDGTIIDNGVDDVQFFRDLLQDLGQLVVYDPARVYVNGFSNGGGMTYRLSCHAADQITAAGVVAAAIGPQPDGCAPDHPVPVMAFHGTADPLVPYGGRVYERNAIMGPGLYRKDWTLEGVESWIERWAGQNECSPGESALAPQGDTRGIEYTGCSEDARVVLYTILDGGHTWPGGRPIPLVGRTNQDIDASEMLWAFYETYALPR